MNAEERVKPRKDQTQNNVSVVVASPTPVRTSVKDLPGVAQTDSSSDDVVIGSNPYAPQNNIMPGNVAANILSTNVGGGASVSVDYPHLFAEGLEMSKTLKKSAVYGDILASAPTTTESIISSRDRGLEDELNEYEAGESTLEACTFCLQDVYPSTEAITRLPCCGFMLHEACFRRRGWHHLPAELKCPDCSRPTQISIDYEKEPEPPDIEDTQTFVSKLRLLVRKRGVTAGLKGIHQAYKSGEGIQKGFPEVTKNEVIRSKLRLDDLLTAGFSLDTIHTTMGVKSWKDFLAIGFNEDKLPKLEAHVGTLTRLYGIDSTCLRRDLRLSLKKLAGLNLRSTTLRDLGFDTHELCFMGLQKNGIKWFRNLTMANWVEHLNFSKIHLGILKINRKDFDNPECLAPVFWNAEGLREKLNITEGNAIRIRLIDPRDLEQREWRKSYTIHTPAIRKNSNHGRGSPRKPNPPPAAAAAVFNRQQQQQQHPSGYTGFRTQLPSAFPLDVPVHFPATTTLQMLSPATQQMLSPATQQPIQQQQHHHQQQPIMYRMAPPHQAPPGILPVPRQLYYHPHPNYQHGAQMPRPMITPVPKPREVRMRGTSVNNKHRGSPILKTRTGKFS